MIKRRTPSRKKKVVVPASQRPWHRALRILLVIAMIVEILPRPMFDAVANGVPVAALIFTGSQTNQPLIGENYTFTARFDNSSPVDAGYGPYMDLVFPVNGIDGNHGSSTADGTDFISADYLGASVVATELTFPVGATTTGCVTHPYARNAANQQVQYCGTTGDKLVVLQLPFGSFTPGQPQIDVTVSASLSNLADANAPLTITARAGFQYGNDPLNNPTTDPTIISADVTAAITPTILRLRKDYNGPEGEIATGPNDPKSYTVSVDLPTGMTVTDLNLIDKVPSNMQFVSVGGASPGGSSVSSTPSTLSPSIAPTNAAAIIWPSVTGSGASSDASYNLTFYIPKLNASSTDVINPSTGGNVASIDDVSANAFWTPIDVRDSPSLVTSDASAADHTLSDTPIAAQKSSAIVTDTGPAGLTPGDTVEYTVVFQISDFFAFQNVHATDTISDGQLLDGTFTPTFTFTRDGTTSTGSMSLSNVTSTRDSPGTGNTYLDLDLSSELADRTHVDAGNVIGGCIASGGSVADCALQNGGLTHGTIKYRTVVQTTYTDDYPSGFPNVDQGDQIDNVVRVRGEVIDTTALTPTGGVVTNYSDEVLFIITGTLTQKTVYAVNGSTSFALPVHIAPGDTVTYRLQVTQPTSNLDSFIVSDYLPLPIFTATSVTSFVATVDASVPAAGVAKFGPNDTFFGTNGITPILTTDGVSNKISFDYGDDISPGTQIASTADIIFTVTASDIPFADGLFLTNQAQSTQGDTQFETAVSTQIVQIILNEPNLNMTKGAVTSDSSIATFSPTTVGPVTFQSPSGTCPSFSGAITSTNLDTSPIGSDVSRIDKGDQVKFAVVIENTGESPDGAFDVQVKDILPTGMSVSSTGLHLCVMRGDGVAIPYTDLGGGLFGSGIELNDASSTQGSIDGYSATGSQNLAIITYDLTSNGNTIPNGSTTNTATVFHYAGDEAGPDFTAIDLTDSVSVTTKAPTISKSILGTNATSSAGNEVVIGEQIQYQATVTVPEATSTGVTFVDALPAGMAVISLDSLTASSTVNTTAGGGFAGALSSAVVSNSGRTTTITLGTVTNNDTNNSATETVQLVFTAVMTNIAGNQGATTRINAATWNWGSDSISANAPTLTIREPVLSLIKTASPSAVAGGETTTFTLTVSHASTSTEPAFEVELADILPANLAYVASSFANTSGIAAVLDDSNPNHLTATWSMLGTTSSSVITFQAVAANNVAPGSVLTNTANVHWTTLQGNQSASSSPYVSTGCERTGNPSLCGAAANDQSATSTRNVSINTATISKSLIATSSTSTSGTNVAIGEILTYQVTIGIPDGTQSTGTTLADTLPANGLSIVDLISIDASGTLATSHAGGFAGVLADANVSSSGALATFYFDDLTNSDSVTGTIETIVVTYRAVALNTTSNVKGTTRNNSAAWHWTGGTVTGAAGNVTIAEPVLKNILTATSTTGDAGDLVTYTVTVSNASTSTAASFELSLNALVPTDMTYVPSSFVNVSGEPAVLNDGTSTSLGATWSSFGVASSSVLQFQATAATSVTPGQAVVTTSTLTFTSLQGDVTSAQSVYNTASCERTGDTAGCGTTANTYTVRSTRAFSVPAPAAVKALIATSATHTASTSVAIGESATYQFTVTLPEGTTNALTLHDQLPNGLQYVGSSVVVSSTYFEGTVPSPSIVSVGGNGDDVDVIFGPISTNADNVTTNNSFTVSLQVLVLNVAGNSTGALLDNSASVSTGSSSSTSNHVALIIVEPDLQTVKTVDNSNPAFGDVVTFTLTVQHTGSSNADAFEPVVTDLIPAGTTYFLGSTVLPSGWSVDETGNPTIVFNANELLFASSSAIITYQVTAGDPSSTSLGSALTNYATTTWTSLPGVDSGERTGAGGVNDYSHTASKALIITGPDIFISKTDSGVSVAPSGTVAYAVTYGNQGNGADSGIVLHETVPVGSVFNNGASTPGWSCPNNSIGGTACNLTIGILGAGASSTITFAVTAVSPAASGVTNLSNVATITDAGTSTDPTLGDHTTNDTTPVNAAPDLLITKTDGATSTVPGAVMGYALSYANIGNQDAVGVTITETVPANSTFNSASSSVGWSGCVNGSASGTVCTYTVGSVPVVGGGGSVAFAVQVDYPLLAFTASLANTATIADDGTNGTDTDLSNNSATDTDVIIQQGPEYSVTVTDGVSTISPGDTVTYLYTITNNGNVNGTGVVVSSTISTPYLNIVSISNGGVASTTASGTIFIVWPSFSLVGNGTSVVRSATMTLDPATPTSLTSTIVTATVGDDLLNGAEPILTNNAATDTDTVVFPTPPGGGGGPPGGGPPSTPPVYEKVVYLNGVVVSSTEPVLPPQPKPTCTVTCADTTYDLSIINPDGSERRVSGGYAQIEKISATVFLYRFEDKGVDFDYNDVLIEVDKSNCLKPIFTVKTVNARWHHQIKAEIYVKGVLKDRMTLWTDSHAAVGQSQVVDAANDAQLCAVASCKLESCAGVDYQLYIINPDGKLRESGTKYVKTTKVSSTVTRYGFEDKGDDFDYNDVVVDVDNSTCSNILVSADPLDARWHHQIRFRLLKDGMVKDDLQLWSDSHEAPGQGRAVNALTDEKMCLAPSLGDARSGVTLYEHINYGGESETYYFGQDVPDLTRSKFSNIASSIKVFGNAAARLFRDTLYKGVSQLFTKNNPDLRKTVIGQDTASSIQILSWGVAPVVPQAPTPPPLASTVTPVESAPVRSSACRPASPITQALAPGSNGAQVLVLQNFLVCLGVFPAGVVPNSNYGPSTIEAVKRFQTANGITATGSVGPVTMKAINGYAQ